MNQHSTTGVRPSPQSPLRGEEPPEEFRALFRDLVIAFQPRGLDRDAVCVYYWALKEWPPDVLGAAARHLTLASKFFPTTGEWAAVADAVVRSRILERVEPVECECEKCAGRGLIRVMYRDGSSFDIAICDCDAGQWYRQAGEQAVRLRLNLEESNRVGLLEDFEGDEP